MEDGLSSPSPRVLASFHIELIVSSRFRCYICCWLYVIAVHVALALKTMVKRLECDQTSLLSSCF